jgi:hypothetical protein
VVSRSIAVNVTELAEWAVGRRMRLARTNPGFPVDGNVDRLAGTPAGGDGAGAGAGAGDGGGVVRLREGGGVGGAFAGGGGAGVWVSVGAEMMA